jgi:Protein of unknown function (DUF3443)
VRRIVFFAVIQLLFLAACGGSGSGSLGGGTTPTPGGPPIATAADNVTPLVVDLGPNGGAIPGIFNTAYITVTVCAPGSTTNCQAIDHVEVDTGSYGLRIISSTLTTQLLGLLPQETDAVVHNPIAECTQFGDGNAWGSLRTADVHVSNELAAKIPIQVIGDPAVPNIPTACSANNVRMENTVALFGANGILGVGPFVQDCGQACASGTTSGLYYICPQGGTTCNPSTVPLTQQVPNPVVSFTTDNNGVIVELPAVADAGAPTVTGALVFGIGTEGNNGLGSAVVLTADPNSGFISVTYKGASYPNGFIDSGSNLNYIQDSSISLCGTNTSVSGFYCPSSELHLSATNVGANGTNSAATFNVANANTLFTNNPSFTAFNNVAVPNTAPQAFDFGLPFFFGRNVFTAIEGKNSSGGMGPYFAY